MPHVRDILGMPMEQLGGNQFDCGCGRAHAVDFSNLLVMQGAIDRLTEIAQPFSGGRVLLVADANTYAAAGSRVSALLKDAGFAVDEKILSRGTHTLVPDEWAVGSIYVALQKNTSLIVAVGSGTINDLCRTISARTRIPYCIVCTAPSMDGYASTVAPLIVEGKKITYEAVAPYAILADTEVLKDAPHVMLRAGFGDIIGKITALADWELSEKLTGEYRCAEVVSLVRGAVSRCVASARRVAARDAGAIGDIAQALVLTGVAMSLVGNSRPASGAEHHFSHYWEVDALARGIEHPLHGNSVGAATPVVAYCFHALDIPAQYGIDVPQPEQIEEILRSAGAAANPQELGIEKDTFYNSVLHALEIRPRYTVLQYAKAQNRLQRLADELTARYYG